MLISFLVLKLLYGKSKFCFDTDAGAHGVANTIQHFFDNSYSTGHQNGNIQKLLCCIVRTKRANSNFVTFKFPFIFLTMQYTHFLHIFATLPLWKVNLNLPYNNINMQPCQILWTFKQIFLLFLKGDF